MKLRSKVALALVALGLSSFAMAGEVVSTTVSAIGAGNTSAGLASTALQNIGVAEQNGHIGGSAVLVNGAFNTSAGLASSATQNLGHASGNGRIDNTLVGVNGAFNSSAGLASTAKQQVGFADNNGRVTNSFIEATGVSNTAAGLASSATQEVGGASNNGVLQNSKLAKEKVKQEFQERRAAEQSNGNDNASPSCGSQSIGNVDTNGRIGTAPREVFVFAPNAINLVTANGCH